VVEEVAREAESYLAAKLEAAEAEYELPAAVRRGVSELCW